MPNIKLSYFYRDCGNYKNFGFVILSNSGNMEFSAVKALIASTLIDGQWFYAKEWLLPELFFDQINFQIDPSWHEFENIEYTFEPATTLVTLDLFLKGLSN
jgi:hypothetical protein